MSGITAYTEKPKHWLYPFRHRITGITFGNGVVKVSMSVLMDELKLDFNPESMVKLGILEWSCNKPYHLRHIDYFTPKVVFEGKYEIELTIELCDKLDEMLNQIGY